MSNILSNVEGGVFAKYAPSADNFKVVGGAGIRMLPIRVRLATIPEYPRIPVVVFIPHGSADFKRGTYG